MVITKNAYFWQQNNYILDNISNELSIACEDFDEKYKERCQKLDLKFASCHCTRSNKPEAFKINGILPLSKDVLLVFLSEVLISFEISISDQDRDNFIINFTENDFYWQKRISNDLGPCFFLSCLEAKNEDNGYLRSGSEICWAFIDSLIQYCNENSIVLPTTDRFELRKKMNKKMTPMAIHCLIPYSFLLETTNDFTYYSRIMFQTYFNYLDPTDDHFDRGEINLNGSKLEPKCIINIEIL